MKNRPEVAFSAPSATELQFVSGLSEESVGEDDKMFLQTTLGGKLFVR